MRGFGQLSMAIGATILASAPLACSGGAPAPAVCSAPNTSAESSDALVRGNTDFAAALFGPATRSVGDGKNVIFSPYSVTATLTMVQAGAAGQTAAQIASVLHLPGGAKDIAPAYATVACADETAGSTTGNTLAFANSVWAQQGMGFEHAFTSLLEKGYAAPLNQVDFATNPAGATTTIDKWVSTMTGGKIPSLLGQGDVDSDTRLMLVNAVSFAGTWEHGFDPGKTSTHPFVLTSGQSAMVPMMSGKVRAGGSTFQMEGNGAWITALELPYMGGALALDVVMPTGSLSELEAALSADLLRTALDAAAKHPTETTVLLPKFSFTTKVALAPVLESMGITDVFEAGSADLSGMDGRRDLYLQRVVHQATVEVDEHGTVAAAATAGGIGTQAVLEPTTIDRPFLFVIRDTTNGSVLFMGHVEDPRA